MLLQSLSGQSNHTNSTLSPQTGWQCKLSSLFVTACLFLFILTSCTQVPASSTALPGLLGEVMRRGTLVIATDPEYPPQSELLTNEPRAQQTLCAANEYTSNQMRGFDVDTAVEIAKRLGVEPCFVIPPWSQIVSGSWNDRWDISIGSMAITTERMQSLYFTQPYTSGAAVVFVHKDNQTYQKAADLSGKRIGVCAGCAYEYYLQGILVIPGQKIQYQIQNPSIIGYDTDTTALSDLAIGDGARLDAVLTDPDTGKLAISEGLAVRQLEEPIYRDYVAAAIDKKSSADPIPFVKEITRIIAQMHADGFLKTLTIQYYQGDYATPASQYDIIALKQYPTP